MLVASDASEPTSIVALLAASDADRPEPEAHLATELLGTVSTSAIQLHPAEATEPMTIASADEPSQDRGAAVSQEPASDPDAGPASPEPAHAEPAAAAEE